jgi:hypothetical protein
MSTKNITVTDTRLAQRLVNYGASHQRHIQVDAKTSMPELMRKIKESLDYPNNKIAMLIIAAHGYSVTGMDGGHFQGFGMQLCDTGLDIKSVHFFRALDGLFADADLGITLLGCGAAAQSRVITKNGGVEMGFGERLCKAMAQATSTGVMASSDVQRAEFGEITERIKGNVATTQVIDPGGWEGDVWIFKPDGTKIKVTTR